MVETAADNGLQGRSLASELLRAAQAVAADLRAAPAFCALAAALTMTLAYGSAVRNEVWLTEGRLWRDIVRKNYDCRLIDPASGLEAPRAMRARMYNNIGLVLYNQGQELQDARGRMKQIVAALQELELGAAQTDCAGERKSLLEHDLAVSILKATDARSQIFYYMPDEVRGECQAAGVVPDRDDWDALLPAEACFRRALYHNSRFQDALCNLGLCYKLRSYELPRGSLPQREMLLKAAEYFLCASAVYYGYANIYRHLAEVYLNLGEAETARKYALRSYECHLPEQGEVLLAHSFGMIIVSCADCGRAGEAEKWLQDGLLKWPHPGDARDVILEAENYLRTMIGKLPVQK